MAVKGRTVRQFQATEDIWAKADAWAAQTGYQLMEQDESSRLYQRGKGFWVAPQMVKLTAMPGGYTIEAWVRVPKFTRVMMLGLMPGEIVIDRGGFVAVIPRNRAREDVNKLLYALGVQPYIE
jgi:hypothetical protein